MGRYVVVVDEDIDIANIDEVIWAMATRSDPKRSIEIISRTLGGDLNTASPPEDLYTSRAIIDACRPFEWKEQFARTVGVSSERAREIRKAWPKLFARSLSEYPVESIFRGYWNPWPRQDR